MRWRKWIDRFTFLPIIFILYFDCGEFHIKRDWEFNKISIFYYLRLKSIRIISAVKLKMRRR